MPAYLFTLHGHRTWMPDHPRGYTTRAKGYRASDERAADAYQATAKHERVVFESDLQRWMIDELIHAQKFLEIRLHAAATESTHVHFLTSWSHDRDWESVRRSLRTSMTRRVRLELRVHDDLPGNMKTPVFSDGGSRKQVADRHHFDHLMTEYLPSHSGLGWYESTGWANDEASSH